ncbi:uncharacterized protein EV420DRAFT_1648698 [Desarmillaria tabescens]|uniref:Glycan binding protein Y3-like domain-containing protein n=1 Tax=Armillaria tabescens TaxID=1929756 RepID=A0AA39JNK1_ARMTA|nr:uncharacterized protein EV420DRAFT_1648698 [Desarmillaria tabescens]KAK0444594.1 hypothetical protein EV420DRAFT_1648698 [Desarmillaria tabescens]
MKFIFSLVFMALAAISSVAAEGCFSGGQPGTCDDAAYTFCHAMLGINGGKASLGDSERRSRCYNTSRGYKCDMRALNTKSSTRTITEADCASAMFTNGNCDHEGKKTINGIEYTADPNEGTC